MLSLRERWEEMQTFLIQESNCHKEHERKTIKAQHFPKQEKYSRLKVLLCGAYGDCFVTDEDTVV